MIVVYSDKHQSHAPDRIFIRGAAVPYTEAPSRVEHLLSAIRDAGHEIVAPRDFGLAPIEAVHSADYLTFLQTAHSRWLRLLDDGAVSTRDIHPHTFAVRRMHVLPSGLLGQIGWYIAGASAPITEGTWNAAFGAAHVALEAAERLRSGEGEAYALCRPPGHHAYGDLAGGFCYLNNAAIAAQYLACSLGKVAILDIDVHHGNGTQDIFYHRDDVHFVSIHGDPNDLYPFYAGYAGEIGEGKGAGHTKNLPLPRHAGDDPFLKAIEEGLASIERFQPAALVVSLGFDAFKGDPTAHLAVSTAGFYEAGKRIGGFHKPVLLVQEGGYATADLGRNLSAFLDGFLPRPR